VLYFHANQKRFSSWELVRYPSQPSPEAIWCQYSINPPDYECYARAAVEEGVKFFETADNNRMAFLVLVKGRSNNDNAVSLVSKLAPDQMLQE